MIPIKNLIRTRQWLVELPGVVFPDGHVAPCSGVEMPAAADGGETAFRDCFVGKYSRQNTEYFSTPTLKSHYRQRGVELACRALSTPTNLYRARLIFPSDCAIAIDVDTGLSYPLTERAIMDFFHALANRPPQDVSERLNGCIVHTFEVSIHQTGYGSLKLYKPSAKTSVSKAHNRQQTSEDQAPIIDVS